MRINRGHRLEAVLAVTTIVAVANCGGQRAAPESDLRDQVRIGYDRLPAEDVTGSVSSLSGEELQSMRVSQVAELIRDRMPGVQVSRRANGDYSFRIRGTRSLIGNNEPLLVIDGIPVSARTMSAALAGLAPTQVTRIDVLKDAGSTAAYGSRGANGVILITTRGHERY